MSTTTTPTEPQENYRRHKLMPASIRKAIPNLYETESVDTPDKVVQVKFFSPYSNWTWYAVEFDGQDTFFGFVDGLYPEWGYFSFSELANAQVFGSVPAVERDCLFTPCVFSEIHTGH